MSWKRTLLVTLLSCLTLACTLQAPNIIVVSSPAGSGMADVPVTLGRAFRQGEITGTPVAWTLDATGSPVARLPSQQADVKTRWADGSVKYAVMSLLLEDMNGQETRNLQFLPGSASTGRPLTRAEMLSDAYDFDATIRLEMGDGTRHEVSARQMLERGHYTTWLAGPVVTGVIIEDRTGRSFDTGSTVTKNWNPLHPVFEARFYPALGKVEVDVSLENFWRGLRETTSADPRSYSLTVTLGKENEKVILSHTNYQHKNGMAWAATGWVGQEPVQASINHNPDYLVTTGAIPAWDTTLNLSPSLIATYAEGATVQGSRWDLDGDTSGIGFQYTKSLNDGGAGPHLGMLYTNDVVALLSQDSQALKAMYRHHDLLGRMPFRIRYAPDVTCNGTLFSDEDFSDRDGWSMNTEHRAPPPYLPYLLSGRFRYKEWVQSWRNGRAGCSEYDAAAYVDSARAVAWLMRDIVYADYVTPDTDTVEKAYRSGSVKAALARLQGVKGLSNDYPDFQKYYDDGIAVRENWHGWGSASIPVELGQWYAMGIPGYQSGYQGYGNWFSIKPAVVKKAEAPWQTGFQAVVLGLAREMGYEADSLLAYMIPQYFAAALDPQLDIHYLGAYTWPTKDANGNFITSISQLVSLVDSEIPSAFSYPATHVTDHAYALIALSAMAQFTPYVWNGHDGHQAYETAHENIMLASTAEGMSFRQACETQSPKWCMVAYDQLSEAGQKLPYRMIKDQTQTDGSDNTDRPDPTNSGEASGPNDPSGGESTQPDAGAPSDATSGNDSQQDTVTPPNHGSHLPLGQINQWTEISGMTYAQRDAGQIPRTGIMAFSGAGYDTAANQIHLFGGGHADYWGNEIWTFDLNNAATGQATWHKQYEPTRDYMVIAKAHRTGDRAADAAAINAACEGKADGGIWLPDASPISRHTYGSVFYRKGKLYAGGGSTYSGPSGNGELLWKNCYLNSPRDFWSYDFSTNTWTNVYNKVIPGQPFSSYGAYVPNEDVFYMLGKHNGKARIARMEMTDYSLEWLNDTTGSAGTGTTMMYDALRHQLVYLTTTDNGVIQLVQFDLQSKTWQVKPLQGDVPSKTSIDGRSDLLDGVGLAHDTRNDVYGLYNFDGLYMIDPVTGVTSHADGNALSLRYHSRVYNRFFYSPHNHAFVLVHGDKSQLTQVHAFQLP